MDRLVIKDNITSGEALALGQTLRLDSFIMGARPAIKPEASQLVAKNRLHVGPDTTTRWIRQMYWP